MAEPLPAMQAVLARVNHAIDGHTLSFGSGCFPLASILFQT
ncbi:hypothetical protein COLO4_37627 [Corchorus olitorius]|uniref:Uncharacterized protein n=1 Tax=Corchorus olitorius TaxID=93759 RepID=A0A1R3G0E5_9ROSI|nr:hypothetical protein COLO4_37627 [Corchorus olitorius]